MKINHLIVCAVVASTSAAGDAGLPGLKQLRGLNIKDGVQVGKTFDVKVRSLPQAMSIGHDIDNTNNLCIYVLSSLINCSCWSCSALVCTT